MFAKSLTTAALGALLFAAPAAHAAVTVVVGPNPGESSATFTPNPGSNVATFNFNGFSGNGGATIEGLTATLMLELIGITPSMSGTTNFYSFNYVLSNTSGGKIDASRVSGFGFNSDPDFLSKTAVSGFNALGSGNLSSGSNVLEFCAKNGGGTNNCAGGGNGGPTLGNSLAGSFDLEYASSSDTIKLTDFAVRYQSIESTQLGIRDGSGIGRPIMSGIVPEPATWAMMILGFGLIGGALRSRKAQVARVTYA